mgnify:CR=1 FL=1
MGWSIPFYIAATGAQSHTDTNHCGTTILAMVNYYSTGYRYFEAVWLGASLYSHSPWNYYRDGMAAKLSSLIYHWNQWLGGIAFILAVWGILALFPAGGILRQVSLGGNLGLDIIGSQDIAGILRILGLVIVGIGIAVAKRKK